MPIRCDNIRTGITIVQWGYGVSNIHPIREAAQGRRCLTQREAAVTITGTVLKVFATPFTSTKVVAGRVIDRNIVTGGHGRVKSRNLREHHH
jgi:hypothetical protein